VLENAALIGFEAIAASQQRRMLCPMRSEVLGAPCVDSQELFCWILGRIKVILPLKPAGV